MKPSIQFILFFYIAYTSLCIAQNNPLLEMQKPAAADTMPEWAKLLYAEPINIFQLDQAYTDFYKVHPYKKSHWIRYYKRWRKWIQPMMDSSGIVKNWDAHQWESYRIKNESFHIKSNQNLRQPLNEWKDKGPYSTQWIANDNARDTFCPWQANIYALEISKSNPAVLYCITETGSLFRTNNKGKSWELRGTEYSLGSEAIAINPINENIILVAINSAIRKSFDGGKTFKTVFNNNNFSATDIRFNPRDSNLVFAASTTGLWKSSNGGNTWSNLITDQCLDIEFHPTNIQIMYVLKKNASTNFYECWKSSNKGTSFFAKTIGWPIGLTNGVGRLAVSSNKPENVYAVLLTSDKPRLIKSNDAAENWTITAKGETTEFGMDNWQGIYDLDLVVNSANADEIIVGTASTWKSTDGGVNFTNIGGYGGKFNLHPDLQVARNNGSDTYVCTDGGINYSNDFFGNHYEYRTFGISSTDMWGFGSGWNEDIFVGGRYHNGNTIWHENYGKQSFLRMGGAESATGYVNPVNNKQVYFSDIGSYLIGQDIKDKVIAQPVSLWPNESYYNMEYSEMEFHPLCHNIYFIGNGSSIYRTENNGVSFTKLFTVPEANASVEHIEISRTNPDLMFFSHRNNNPAEGKIWVSFDGGINWKTCADLPVTNGQRRVMNISMSEDHELFVVLRAGPNGSKIFKSNDYGQTWTNWTTVELNDQTLTGISYQLSSENGMVYISASDGKVFYRDRSMNKWESYNNQLPINHQSVQLRPFYRNQKLRSAGSNGIWEIDFVTDSKCFAQANVDKLNTSCERDTFYFDDYSVFPYDGKEKWEWDFPGAIYVDNNFIRNPKVVYSKEGVFDITLKISNATSHSDRTFAKMISVKKSDCNLDKIPGLALNMDGSKKVISISPITKLKNAKGFTVMCWIKIKAKQEWFTQLISSWGGVSNFGFGFAFQGYVPTTNLTFSWTGVPYQLTTTHEVPINQWTHVALTIDSIKAIVYMDGKSWTYNKSLPLELDKLPFIIGNGVPGQGGTFNGWMDELKMYRRALTQNEIREQMHLIPNKIDTDMVMYYQFNEKIPTTIYDKSGVSHGSNGDSPLSISTLPIGPGVSDRLTINSNQNYNLANTKINLDFSPNNTGTTPNGEVVLYRINLNPDTINASNKVLAKEYMVLRNWGTNTTFSGLKNIIISNSGIQSMNSELLYRTPANAEGPIWSNNKLAGQSSGTDIKFINSQNLINSACHFLVGGDQIATGLDELKEKLWTIRPNPMDDYLFIKNNLYTDNKFEILIFTENGINVLQQEFKNEIKLSVKHFPAGKYYYQIVEGTKIILQNVLIKI